MTKIQIERLYGRLQGWEEARRLLKQIATQEFEDGNDDHAVYLRDLAQNAFQEKVHAAEDAWREVEPNAVPRER